MAVRPLSCSCCCCAVAAVMRKPLRGKPNTAADKTGRLPDLPLKQAFHGVEARTPPRARAGRLPLMDVRSSYRHVYQVLEQKSKQAPTMSGLSGSVSSGRYYSIWVLPNEPSALSVNMKLDLQSSTLSHVLPEAIRNGTYLSCSRFHVTSRPQKFSIGSIATK